MSITRLNFQLIKEFQPTISFTLAHLGGAEPTDAAYSIKNLKCFEIQYEATGNIALQLLASGLEMSKKLALVDMHVSYKRGMIIYQILTALPSNTVEEYVQQKGRQYYINYSLNRKRKKISLWKANKQLINESFNNSLKFQNFVLNLSRNLYSTKKLVLV